MPQNYVFSWQGVRTPLTPLVWLRRWLQLWMSCTVVPSALLWLYIQRVRRRLQIMSTLDSTISHATGYDNFIWIRYRSRTRTLWIKKNKIHRFYSILKMPTEFYFEIQYLNFNWKITITLLHSHGNTQQWKVKSVFCYSESESATTRCSHSTAVST